MSFGLSELHTACPPEQSLSEQGWTYVCSASSPIFLLAALFWLSSLHVSCAVWLKGTGLCTLGAKGSVDKKSSLLPQIHRLNVASRTSAALGANGSKTQLCERFGLTFLSLWSLMATHEWSGISLSPVAWCRLFFLNVSGSFRGYWYHCWLDILIGKLILGTGSWHYV